MLPGSAPQVWSCGWGREQPGPRSPGERLCSPDRVQTRRLRELVSRGQEEPLCLPGATEGGGHQEAGARGRGQEAIVADKDLRK